MADYTAPSADEQRPGIDSASAGDTKSVIGTYVIPAGGQTWAASETVALVKIPGDHVVIDAILDTEAVGAGITVDVGKIGGTGQELMDAKSLAAAAVFRADQPGMTRVPVSQDETVWGLTVQAGAAATAGKKVSVTFQYRTSLFGE